ncbi:MAG: T9SS type A sorting domain-containing protein [Parafilimonas sp.]|nr:T9SS type A sorting domain-containing protein [Parafilimonas sp.]
MVQTSDGGMVLCGYSNSNISGDKTQNSINDSYDFWIVKIGKTGLTQWAKTYGGSDRDLNPTIIQTQDSGFLVAGSSISPASGIKTEDAINESFDYWALKLDKLGNKIWDNTVGGIQFEKLVTVLESSSGYFLCGSSNSTLGNDKSLPNEGSSLWPDYWIVKLNKKSGVVIYDSTYGSKNRDALATAKITKDGGIILGGTSYSPKYGHKSEDFFGNGDYWVVKLDSLGREQWDKTIGGSLSDYLTSIDLVGNVGYVLGGYSNSPASFNKSKNCKGITDYWIVKIDNTGNVLWDKTYGGVGADYVTSIKYTKGNYLVGGYSNSNISGDKTSDSKGGYDFWNLTLDKSGKLLDQSDWGGSADDLLVDYEASGKTEYLLGGSSYSPKSGDKAVNTIGNTGNSDYWVFKVSPAGPIAQVQTSEPVIADAKTQNFKTQVSFDVSPNPVKDVLHIKYNAPVTQNISISVYTNSGKMISQQILTQPNGNVDLDLSAQLSGIYYAVLQSGSSSFTKKFVKN